MSRLEDIANRWGTDKVAHGYCQWYERHLSHMVNHDLTILEIGVESGASLRTWAEWFPWAQVIGVDIAPLEIVETDRILTVITDIKDYVPGVLLDVVIDDGSHTAEDVSVACRQLWPKVKAGGWYIIEDLSTQFLPEWGGTPEGSTATEMLDEFCHRLIGELIGSPSDLAEFHAYPRIVFIRKREDGAQNG